MRPDAEAVRVRQLVDGELGEKEAGRQAAQLRLVRRLSVRGKDVICV